MANGRKYVEKFKAFECAKKSDPEKTDWSAKTSSGWTHADSKEELEMKLSLLGFRIGRCLAETKTYLFDVVTEYELEETE